jgi:aspartate-semialdehyde dehydrogenase
MTTMGETNPKRVAVVGATGVVGQTIARVLEERGFPLAAFVPVASGASAGGHVDVMGQSWPVVASEGFLFDGVEICLFTAGAAVSRELVPLALKAGCRVVDNTTAFRMDSGVPLVVPEINGALVTPATNLVSCPNCTAVNLVMSLYPLLDAAEIVRVVVTSFQSVSGAGREAMAELDEQSAAVLDGGRVVVRAFPKRIAFNCVPRIGELLESGYTSEEEKIIEETKKILGAPNMEVNATAVRVPVHVGHSLSVNVEFAGPVPPEAATRLWHDADGVAYDRDLPTPLDIAGSDTVVVGRVRRDATRAHALSYWVVGDNLRKGAATNSVQIAERFLL